MAIARAEATADGALGVVMVTAVDKHGVVRPFRAFELIRREKKEAFIRCSTAGVTERGTITVPGNCFGNIAIALHHPIASVCQRRANQTKDYDAESDDATKH